MTIKVKCQFPIGDLLLATANLQDSSGNWQNKIISISSLSRNIGEDKSYEVSGMSIELNDTDRFFRTMMSGINRFIVGKKVELFSEDDQLIYTGTVEKWQFQEDTFVVFINDKLSGLDILVPGIMTKDDYPNMAEKAEGQSIPIIYGHVSAEAGAVKCWRVNTNTFLLAGHHCKELVDNAAYKEDGTPIVGASLDNNADGKAYVQCTSAGDFVYVNVKGKMDGSSNLMEDPIDALKNLIDSPHISMGYSTEGMNTAQEIMNARNYKIAAVIDNQQNLNDVLVDFCFSFDCDFYIGKGNEIMISLLKWSALIPQKSFTEKQVVEFQLDELPEEIRNKVKYMYKYNFAEENFQKTPVYTKESSIENWGEFYNRNEALDLRYVSDDDAAVDVVQRFVIQRKNPRRIAQLTLPLCEYVGLDISDIIEITHPAAIHVNKRKYQIRRVNIDFLADIVQVEAVDITSMTGGMFVLGDRDWVPETLPPKWSDSDEFSRNYGYLADRNTGYFSNGTDYGKVLY
ncbi:MAG: hypothetical protein GTO45_37750 [Candidatus Aminicenantes bacterium]|nr:hypothetical protein [Candidatus Aminicenantes bacterium]NIM84410.1 hypothetical protein [Candidatus Aminicenantes bacterium]NIN18524.1 hypothetical protein [Candidatus Aminicenantes bacterium]NIN42420.1 hypothetical protein [Candidatus Aminicenantes bacterium]NIN90534.1 hypothetical protein [Candidatus Aminicenantes bacterium]